MIYDDRRHVRSTDEPESHLDDQKDRRLIDVLETLTTEELRQLLAGIEAEIIRQSR
jgi:hypothetical protein